MGKWTAHTATIITEHPLATTTKMTVRGRARVWFFLDYTSVIFVRGFFLYLNGFKKN
jgi:hypothetical protein